MADALSTVLDRVDLDGAILSRAEMRAPWGVFSSGLKGGVFHAVLRGQAWIRAADEAPIALDVGDVVLLPRGSAHTLSDQPRRRATPILACPTYMEKGVRVVTGGGEGAPSSILCGRVKFPDSCAHDLFRAAPKVLVARRPTGSRGVHALAALEWILDELSTDEPGRDAIVQRLVEVFVLQLLRSAAREGTLEGSGWLGGLSDPIVSRALALLHQQDGAPTAAGLPEALGVSRSVLYERFVRFVGESPAKYAVRWRMHQAARALVDGGLSVAQASEMAGYATEAAFAKAFKRVVGVPPATFRRSALEGATVAAAG